jgi:2'-5' RNA ligase
MDAASKPLRLFIAVPLTGEVRAQAAACVDALRAAGADAAWLKPETLHVTLRFLGATPADRVPALEKALDAAVHGRSPFTLTLDHLGVFGPSRAPKVVWAGVGEGLEPLKSLAGAVEEALAAQGFAREERPFAAHLTLGRLRSARNAAALVEALERADLRWTLPVDRLILYSSKLGPGGSVHTPLRERRLAD